MSLRDIFRNWFPHVPKVRPGDVFRAAIGEELKKEDDWRKARNAACSIAEDLAKTVCSEINVRIGWLDYTTDVVPSSSGSSKNIDGPDALRVTVYSTETGKEVFSVEIMRNWIVNPEKLVASKVGQFLSGVIAKERKARDA